MNLDFLDEPRNVVLAAAQGLGKTHDRPKGRPASRAARAWRALHLRCPDLLDLGAQESTRAIEHRLQHYAKIGLLILDEIGFLAFDNRNADLLVQVISRRYEKKSTVLTTNLAFRDWRSIFPNVTCATAHIDRVVHHADVIAIEGESYRAREADAQAKARRARRKEQPHPHPAA